MLKRCIRNVMGGSGSKKGQKGNVHFMSQRLDWQTPDDVYAKLDAEFHFDHDPCPPEQEVDSIDRDSLWAAPWGERNFVNPPYGREIGTWLKRGYEESLCGNLSVFLIPSRTDTRWWHDYVMKADEIRFIKGRLKFKGAKNNAPFPSAIVVFGSQLNNECKKGHNVSPYATE